MKNVFNFLNYIYWSEIILIEFFIKIDRTEQESKGTAIAGTELQCNSHAGAVWDEVQVEVAFKEEKS